MEGLGEEEKTSRFKGSRFVSDVRQCFGRRVRMPEF